MTGDGAEAFVGGIGYMLGGMPKLKVDPKRFVAEGDMVAAHVHFITAPGSRGHAAMDFFRLENGKIVEHWDVMQDVPEKIAHKNTMF